jgi:hypothetical protein
MAGLTDFASALSALHGVMAKRTPQKTLKSSLLSFFGCLHIIFDF